MLFFLFGLAINLGLLYLVVRAAIVHAMRRARREDWTKTDDSGNAHSLTVTQRKTLAAQTPQRSAKEPTAEA